jgi:hypothetical protein
MSVNRFGVSLHLFNQVVDDTIQGAIVKAEHLKVVQIPATGAWNGTEYC